MKNIARRVSVAIAAAAALMSVAISPASAAPDLEPYQIPKLGGAAKTAAVAGGAVWTLIVPKTNDPKFGSTAPRCADVAWNSVDNGARTILFDCYGTNNQKWGPIWVESDSQYGTAMFVNANSGKCLDLANGSAANGAHVIQWNCHNGSNQQWDVVLPAGADPQTHVWPVLFKNRATGKCLDLDNANTVNGTGFLQWDCHGNANQLFTLYLPE
ncbi:RICIN domain-containing protein [Lentzea sp. NPDC003310]|uniref:RICIN domain-containing protein n=1 Tax=Lentzea sp. NPDC003310 TaxID=3154447 RepID=UPI0033BF36CA